MTKKYLVILCYTKICGEPGETVIDQTDDPGKWNYRNLRKKLKIKIVEREKYYAEKREQKKSIVEAAAVT